MIVFMISFMLTACCDQVSLFFFYVFLNRASRSGAAVEDLIVDECRIFMTVCLFPLFTTIHVYILIYFVIKNCNFNLCNPMHGQHQYTARFVTYFNFFFVGSKILWGQCFLFKTRVQAVCRIQLIILTFTHVQFLIQ